ncbi:EamA family transporter [Candidatus Saccharibacteria bacterium]|nr:EamA family transporter [Candidatus Saccharibacteria bacterium]
MNWLVLVLITVIFDSTRIFIDNYISDYYFKGREAVSQKLFYGYTFIILALILMLATGVDFSNFTPLVLFFLSGIMHSFAGIPYYRALELDDSTNLGIFIQLAPVIYLIMGWFFLGETFSILQLVAFLIILSGPLLIVMTTRKRSRKVKIKAVFFAFLYVLIAVSANVLFVKENNLTENLSFFTEMAFVFLGKGIGNLIIMYAMPKWRRRFISIVKSSRKKVFRPLISSCVFGVTKDFTYRAALFMAPSVALASAASDSTTPIMIFFMGIVLTILWPNFGREKLNRKSVLIHLIATVLVVAGIILIQNS